MAIKDLTWNPPAGGNAGYWSGTFEVQNDGTSTDTFRLPIGNTTGNIKVKLDNIDENVFPGAEKSINVTDCVSWNLSATSPVTEGGTVTLDLTTNAIDGNYGFSITAPATGQMVGDEFDLSTGVISWDGSKYTGTFTQSGGTVTPITLTVLTDADGNSETFTVQLDNGKASATININELVQTWNLSAPASVTEGNSVTITLNTTNVDNGPIPFSISGNGITYHDIAYGVGEDVDWDIPNSKFYGNFNLSGDTASITLNIIDDGAGSPGDVETFTLSLDNGEDSVDVDILEPAAPAVCGSQIAAWSNGQDNSIITNGVLGQQVALGNYGVQGWDDGGTLYLPELDGVGTSISTFWAINPDTNNLGYFTYITSPITTDFYYENNGVCYKGQIVPDGQTNFDNAQVLAIVD